jgi:hypothetical protein
MLRVIEDAAALFAQLLEQPKFDANKLPVPSSIMRRDLRLLNKNDYWVGTKHDGMRCLLLIGITVTKSRYVALINRAGRVHVCTSAATHKWPAQLSCGTLLDCELIELPEEGVEVTPAHLMVFDAYAIDGFDIKSYDLVTRLQFAQDALKRITPFTTSSPFKSSKSAVHITARRKKFLPATPENLRHAWSDTTLPSDGVVLATRKDAVKMGRLPTYFKFKPRAHHTVDLMYTGTELQCSFTDMIPSGVEVDLPIPEAKKGVVEMVFDGDSANPKLRFVHNRTDKSVANSRFVVDRTLQNFREDLTVDEIAERFS